MNKTSLLWLFPIGMMLSSCGSFMQGMAQAYGYGYGSYGRGTMYQAAPQQNSVPQVKWDFSNINSASSVPASTPVTTSSSSSSSSTAGSSTTVQEYCRRCNGSGRCYNCSDGYKIVTIGAPKTRCVACPTSPGVCEACHGSRRR